MSFSCALGHHWVKQGEPVTKGQGTFEQLSVCVRCKKERRELW